MIIPLCKNNRKKGESEAIKTAGAFQSNPNNNQNLCI